jgi:hypothetical protein
MGTAVQGSAAAVQQLEASTCPTCGEMITGQFCPACGEQKYNRYSFSFRHFARHAAHELFDLDSKILRTVRYLFSRPGFVTAEYLAGKRSRYMNPLRLYVICFAVATLTLLYHSSLDLKTLINLDKRGSLNQGLAKLAQHKGVSQDVLIERLQERLQFYYEWSNIVNALVMAWLLAVVYRKQKWYFGEHAVTALYFLSFTSLLSIVKWPFWVALGAPIQGAISNSLSLAFLLIALPYLWVTLRQLHGEGPWKTAAKSILVYGGTQLTLIVTFGLSFFLATVHTALAH